MTLSRRLVRFCAAIAALLTPASLIAADTLVVHGHIYTGNPKAPWAQALAVTGTRIVAVGTDEEILAQRQAKSELIDLRGRTVIPGISDSHTHMWFGLSNCTGSIFPHPSPALRPIIGTL
jgi:predicted amidohydrolase YtcJ